MWCRWPSLVSALSLLLVGAGVVLWRLRGPSVGRLEFTAGGTYLSLSVSAQGLGATVYKEWPVRRYFAYWGDPDDIGEEWAPLAPMYGKVTPAVWEREVCRVNAVAIVYNSSDAAGFHRRTGTWQASPNMSHPYSSGAAHPAWLIVAGSIVPLWRLGSATRRRLRRRGGLCPRCGYDLRASRERCPECGTEVPAK